MNDERRTPEQLATYWRDEAQHEGVATNVGDNITADYAMHARMTADLLDTYDGWVSVEDTEPPTDGDTLVDLWVGDANFPGGGQRFPNMKYRAGSGRQGNDWDCDDGMTTLTDCMYTLDDITHWRIIRPPVLSPERAALNAKLAGEE